MKLNKALGQNFFANPALADKLVSKIDRTVSNSIVEIGPGDGFFTARLISIFSRVTVIEKDDEIARKLRIKFPSITVINADFLDIDLKPLCEEKNLCYGSLPYNVSKKIIQRCIESRSFEKMYFIVQKEVAQKYVEYDGKSSILSILSGLHANFKILDIIKPGAFIPQPKVDSAYIEITLNENFKKVASVTGFETFIKRCFASPRKTLSNNLKILKDIDLGEFATARPENLSLDDYAKIYNQYEEKSKS